MVLSCQQCPRCHQWLRGRPYYDRHDSDWLGRTPQTDARRAHRSLTNVTAEQAIGFCRADHIDDGLECTRSPENVANLVSVGTAAVDIVSYEQLIVHGVENKLHKDIACGWPIRERDREPLSEGR